MLVGKQVADLLTLIRAFLGIALAWLGLAQGVDGLPWAVWLLFISWTTDLLDGPLARRSRVVYRNWLGEHDLEVDMFVAGGLLIFMTGAEFLSLWFVIIYLALWGMYFFRWGVPRSLGMLFQAPVYGYFLWVSLQEAPEVGRWLVFWILITVIVTWPLFPQKVIPGFLSGLSEARSAGQNSQNQRGNG